MKATRANVEAYAKEKGLEPVQIDGIPEGFSYKAPDVIIGDKNYEGTYIVIYPGEEWDGTITTLPHYTSATEERLVRMFNRGYKDGYKEI